MDARKILVADDSPLVVALVSRALREAGHTLLRATNGIEAVQCAYNEPPDLIILDIFMPRMNGYQVCRLLKGDPVMAAIPIVILSASEERSDEFWSLQTGADAFMTKPFDPSFLLSTVDRLLPVRAVPVARPEAVALSPEDILSKVSALLDRQLYHATAQRMELRTILDNLSDGILTVDTEGCIQSANPALCRMLGAQEADLIGRPCPDALPEPAGPDTLALCRQMLSGEATRPEQDSEIRSSAGHVTPVSIHVAPLRDHLGKPVGSAGLFQDISRRKEIEALSKVKDDLTHMIVHDLRTPLTSLIGGLQTMEVLGELNADQQEFLHMSIHGGKTLLGMINELLEISKLEDGSLKLEYNCVEAGTLAERAEQQVAQLAREKQLTLAVQVQPELPTLWGDEEKLCRTLVNLLGNAIKFTPSGGAVTLGIHRSDQEPVVLFSVQDTGEGIPREAFERIFEKFGQVETRKAGRKMSTGLGLTFCKMAAEAHGGRIWVESEPNVGSTFSFTLPLVPVQLLGR